MILIQSLVQAAAAGFLSYISYVLCARPLDNPQRNHHTV